MKANKSLTNALYKECREYILDADHPGISEFSQIINKIDTTDPQTIKSLIEYLHKTIGNSKLVLNTNFNPGSYIDDIKAINEKVVSTAGFMQKHKLNAQNITDVELCLKIAILLNSNLNDIAVNLQQLSLDDIELDKVKVDTAKFIETYNSASISDVCDILNIVDRYKLYNMLSINNKYDELNIIYDVYMKVITNTQLQNVAKFVLLYKQFNPFISDDIQYQDILKHAAIYNGNNDFAQLQLNIDINKLQTLGLYDSTDNIFVSILKTYKLTDTKIFDDMKIKGKDNLAYSYIDNIFKLEPVDIYADKTINVPQLYNVISDIFLNVFKQIDLDNKLLSAFNDITINDKPVTFVLTSLFKNKEQLLKSASIDKKTVEQFNTDLQKQFEQWLGNDIYTSNAADKSIFSNICNILDADGKLNIEYLKKTFKNYKSVVYNIITHFNESDLFTVYKAMSDISALKENYSCIMFGNYILYNELYEDEQDGSTNIQKPQTLGDAFEDIVKKAAEKDMSIVDYSKEISNNTEQQSDNNIVSDTSAAVPPETQAASAEVKNINPRLFEKN